jgi:tetratricopeptide (TPR) repeat protein
MKALRATLAIIFVFGLLQVGCNRKQSAQENTAAPSSDGVTQQQQQGAQPDGDARALYERGMDAYRHNRDEEAVEDFRRAVEAAPDFAEGYYRLGLAYNVTRQADEADKAFEQGVKAFEKMTKQDPKNSDAYYFLGLCYEKLGKYDDAVKALKEAVKNSPDENDDKYFELAQAHYKLAQYDESVRALNKTLEINPDNFPAQELLEQAKSGAARIEEFRKRQEQLRKQQAGNSNSNANNSGKGSNTNTATGSNTNSATAPPT